MKNWVRQLIRLLFYPAAFRPKENQGLIILVSFVLAITLWFLVTINQTYDTRLSFPFQVTGIPQAYQLTEELPAEIQVEARGPGVDLIGLHLTLRRDTLEFPYQDEFRQEGLIRTQPFRELVAKVLPAQLEVKGLTPGNLAFSVEKKISKQVPVLFMADLRLPPAYQLEQAPKLSQDSVTVLGPQGQLDTLRFWPTQAIELVVGEKPGILSVPLQDTLLGLEVSPSVVQVYLQPRKYTQTTLRLRLRVTGQPDDVQVRLNHQHVDLSCLLPLDEYEAILRQSRTWFVAIPFDQLDPRIPAIIPQLDLPSSVKVVSRSPFQIQYVIVHPVSSS